MTRVPPILAAAIFAASFPAADVAVEVQIGGVDGELLTNVEAYLG